MGCTHGCYKTRLQRLGQAFDACFLMVIEGGRGNLMDLRYHGLHPMAVIRRAFSALVKAALWAFGKQYFVLLCKTLVLYYVSKSKKELNH